MSPAGLPTISVIIPAYNSARFICRAVDSVLAQEGVQAEIVVVDDASTDETPDVMRVYGERVRYLRREVNRGVAVARNHGAVNARGKWLAFLDADDFYYPMRLLHHAAWIAEDPTLDLLTGDYDYQRADGSPLGTSMAAHPAGVEVLRRAAGAGRFVMETDLFEAFVAEHFGDTHTLTVPRDRFLAVGGYPEGFKVCEDVHLLTRLIATSRRIGVICEPLGVYVVHEGSATRRDPVEAQRENVRTLNDLAILAETFPPQVRAGVQRRRRAARLNLAYALRRHGHPLAATRAVLPSLFEAPSLRAARDVLSILKG
ncbi:MAG: glycosyltransferase family 2 protein [Gammaproteobacteria bacterium]